MKKLTFLTILITILFCTFSLASTAKLMMQNGDSLQAKFYTSELELLTDFGEIAVDTDNIDKVVFLSDDKGRTAVYTTLEGEVFYGTILNDSVEVEVFGNKIEISKDVIKEIKFDNESAEFENVKLKLATKAGDVFFADIISSEIKIKASYGTFNIPVGNIKNIEFEGTAQPVTNIELKDGNSVKGIIDNPTLALRFVFGGEINMNSSKIMNMNMESFSKNSNSNIKGWIIGTEMPTSRYYNMSVAIDNNIWVMGGYNTENENQWEIYNTETNSWENIGQIRDGANEHYFTEAVLYDNKIFLAAGSYYYTHGLCETRRRGDVRLVDPQKLENIWVSDLINRRDYNVVETYGNEIFIIGGTTNKTDIFNPQKSNWRSGAPIPTSRTHLCSVKYNDLFYTFGGFSNKRYLDSAEVYDPKGDQWKVLPPMPTSRRGAVCAEINGEIYVIGGKSSLGYLKTVEIYDPKTQKWTTGEPLLVSTAYATCEVVNGKIYVIGGYNDNGTLNTVQIYQP